MVIHLKRGADLHMAQLMPLPLTVACFSKIQIGFTFLLPAHPRSPGQRDVKRVCVCVTRHQIYRITSTHHKFCSNHLFIHTRLGICNTVPTKTAVPNFKKRRYSRGNWLTMIMWNVSAKQCCDLENSVKTQVLSAEVSASSQDL